MKTIIDKRTLEGVSTLEYRKKKSDKLLFLQHGIYGNKQKIMNLLGISFVKLGYHVVAVDAYKHGSRGEEPFRSQNQDRSALETMLVVKQTAEDIKAIYENHFKEDYPMFDFVGISMGGLIGYYLSTITTYIDDLVALISSPKFLEANTYTFPKEKQAQYPESKEVRKTIETMDPSTKAHTMSFNRLLMFNGNDDDVIPYEQTESFYHQNKDMPIVFKLYDTKHKIVKPMHDDLIKYLKNKSV